MQTLDNGIKPHERDHGLRDEVTTKEAQRNKDLEPKNRELRKAIEAVIVCLSHFALWPTPRATRAMDLRNARGEGAVGVGGHDRLEPRGAGGRIAVCDGSSAAC